MFKLIRFSFYLFLICILSELAISNVSADNAYLIGLNSTKPSVLPLQFINSLLQQLSNSSFKINEEMLRFINQFKASNNSVQILGTMLTSNKSSEDILKMLNIFMKAAPDFNEKSQVTWIIKSILRLNISATMKQISMNKMSKEDIVNLHKKVMADISTLLKNYKINDSSVFNIISNTIKVNLANAGNATAAQISLGVLTSLKNSMELKSALQHMFQSVPRPYTEIRHMIDTTVTDIIKSLDVNHLNPESISKALSKSYMLVLNITRGMNISNEMLKHITEMIQKSLIGQDGVVFKNLLNTISTIGANRTNPVQVLGALYTKDKSVEEINKLIENVMKSIPNNPMNVNWYLGYLFNYSTIYMNRNGTLSKEMVDKINNLKGQLVEQIINQLVAMKIMNASEAAEQIQKIKDNMKVFYYNVTGNNNVQVMLSVFTNMATNGKLESILSKIFNGNTELAKQIQMKVLEYMKVVKEILSTGNSNPESISKALFKSYTLVMNITRGMNVSNQMLKDITHMIQNKLIGQDGVVFQKLIKTINTIGANGTNPMQVLGALYAKDTSVDEINKLIDNIMSSIPNNPIRSNWIIGELKNISMSLKLHEAMKSKNYQAVYDEIKNKIIDAFMSLTKEVKTMDGAMLELLKDTLDIKVFNYSNGMTANVSMSVIFNHYGKELMKIHGKLLKFLPQNMQLIQITMSKILKDISEIFKKKPDFGNIGTSTYMYIVKINNLKLGTNVLPSSVIQYGLQQIFTCLPGSKVSVKVLALQNDWAAAITTNVASGQLVLSLMKSAFDKIPGVPKNLTWNVWNVYELTMVVELVGNMSLNNNTKREIVNLFAPHMQSTPVQMLHNNFIRIYNNQSGEAKTVKILYVSFFVMSTYATDTSVYNFMMHIVQKISTEIRITNMTISRRLSRKVNMDTETIPPSSAATSQTYFVTTAMEIPIISFIPNMFETTISTLRNVITNLGTSNAFGKGVKIAINVRDKVQINSMGKCKMDILLSIPSISGIDANKIVTIFQSANLKNISVNKLYKLGLNMTFPKLSYNKNYNLPNSSEYIKMNQAIHSALLKTIHGSSLGIVQSFCFTKLQFSGSNSLLNLTYTACLYSAQDPKFVPNDFKTRFTNSMNYSISHLNVLLVGYDKVQNATDIPTILSNTTTKPITMATAPTTTKTKANTTTNTANEITATNNTDAEPISTKAAPTTKKTKATTTTTTAKRITTTNKITNAPVFTDSPAVPGEYTVKVKVTIKIKMNWNDKYKNKNSNEFKNMAKYFFNNLQKSFKRKNLRIITFVIISFSQGSVVANTDYTIGSKNKMEKDEMKKAVMDSSKGAFNGTAEVSDPTISDPVQVTYTKTNNLAGRVHINLMHLLVLGITCAVLFLVQF